MSDDTLRELIFDAVTAAVGSLQKHLSDQILELQADVDTALGKLDSIELDVKDTRLQVAKLSREQMKDHRRDESVSKRLGEVERRLSALEKST